MLFDTCFRIVSEKYNSDINDKASVENVEPSITNSGDVKSLDLSDLLPTFENVTGPVVNETPLLADSTEGE
jgi:hypothetical protein